MTEYFIWVVLVALWCWGFHNAFEEGEIFGKIGDWLYNRFPEYWLKPLIGCPICMVSVHGTIWFLLTQDWHFLTWIMFIVSASGLNYVIHNFFPKNDN
jgi:hypothetical protein